MASGRHSISLKASLMPQDEAKAKLELRPRGSLERVAGDTTTGA
jgi:hypothetical protein